MLDLLAQIFGMLWEFVPRPELVGPTQRAACWLLGRYGRAFGPGLYIVWPLVEVWRVVPVVSQLCETAPIPVTDQSGGNWQFRLAIEYEVVDVLLHETMSFSAQNHLEQMAGSAIVLYIHRRTTEQIRRRGLNAVCRQISRKLAADLSDRGLRVVGIRPIMASQSIPVFLSQAERLTV